MDTLCACCLTSLVASNYFAYNWPRLMVETNVGWISIKLGNMSIS